VFENHIGSCQVEGRLRKRQLSGICVEFITLSGFKRACWSSGPYAHAGTRRLPQPMSSQRSPRRKFRSIARAYSVCACIRDKPRRLPSRSRRRPQSYLGKVSPVDFRAACAVRHRRSDRRVSELQRAASRGDSSLSVIRPWHGQLPPRLSANSRRPRSEPPWLSNASGDWLTLRASVRSAATRRRSGNRARDSSTGLPSSFWSLPTISQMSVAPPEYLHTSGSKGRWEQQAMLAPAPPTPGLRVPARVGLHNRSPTQCGFRYVQQDPLSSSFLLSGMNAARGLLPEHRARHDAHWRKACRAGSRATDAQRSRLGFRCTERI